MKKIKIFITILISLLLVLCINNVSFAESYMNREERAQMVEKLNEFKAADKKTDAIGDILKLAYSSLVQGKHLYCVSYHQWLDNPAQYKVVKYLEVEGNRAYIPGTSYETQNNYNIILSEILSGRYGDEYGDAQGIGKAVYTDAQKALYCYFNLWLNTDFWNPVQGQTGQTTNREYFGFDASWNTKAYNADEAGWTAVNDIINEIRDAINTQGANTFKSRVKLYFLEATTSSEYNPTDPTTGQPKPFQKLLIAIPEEVKETELIINKVDKDTGVALRAVSFTVKNKDTGLYVSKATHEGDNKYRVTEYSSSLSNAQEFTTGISKYQNIVLKDLEPGIYEIKETENPNEGYDTTDNVGKTWTVKVEDKASKTVKLENIKDPTTEEEDNPDFDPGEGNVTLSGTVWEDSFSGKSSSIDNVKGTNDAGESERGIEGVRVYWKTSDGSVIASTETDENGNYTMYANISIKNHEYLISSSDYSKINTSYIEFEYNGVQYTTVKDGAIQTDEETDDDGNTTTTSYVSANTSIAKESLSSRNALNNKFQEITKDGVKQDGTKKFNIKYETGKDENENAGHYSVVTQDINDYTVTADTSSTISNMMNIAIPHKSDFKWCHSHCSSGEHKMGRKHPSCYWEDKVVDGKVVGSTRVHVDCYDYYCDTSSHCWPEGYTYEDIDNWEILNVNLGLVKRESPDIALTSDINKVRVIMKDQEYTYYYNNRGIQKPNATDLFDYKVKFGKTYVDQTTGEIKQKYSRPINPADVAYVNYEGTQDLEVYVTYNIVAQNQSTTTPVIIEEIVNYYDSNYTINKANSSPGWENYGKYGESYSEDGYKAVYNSTVLAGKNNMIQPGTKSKVATIEYKVNDDVVKSLLSEDSIFLNNVSEINIYSVYYGKDTRWAEDRKAGDSSVRKNGTQYAGIDSDSAPGNTKPGKLETYEDDTDIAPIFKLCKDPNYKVISGTVWEDKDVVTTDKERLGNGQKSSAEKGVEGVKVQLFKVNDNGMAEPAYFYYISGSNRGRKTLAITYTDRNGQYKLGEESDMGLVVDNYIVQYTYGNGEIEIVDEGFGEKKELQTKINGNTINARNYKSTIITESTVKEAMQNSNDDKWHLTAQAGYSVAVDDLNERISVPALTYNNFDNPGTSDDKLNGVSMSAYSKPFKLQVEYTEDQEADVDEDGGSFEHDLGIFDFGIIERPREDIVIEKTIDNIKITLANGQVLTEGKPYVDSLNYVKALGTKNITTRAQAINARQKFLYIEMDSELIQGARLDLVYKITVTNNSEIDYEYDYVYSDIGYGDFVTTSTNAYYYYYGEKQTPIIKSTVDWVADYMDPELTCTVATTLDDRGSQVSTADVNKINAGTYNYQENKQASGEERLNWIQIKASTQANGTKQTPAEQLRAMGWISENTKNKLEEEKYLIYMTNYFYDVTSYDNPSTAMKENSKSLYLFASKLLANQASDYNYENHVEIVQVNGKVARTIDKVETNGAQVTKTYKPGNYIPSSKRIGTTSDITIEQAGLHEQDDDMIRVVITPPTGLENSTIIYIATGLVGLIVIAGGIYLIKKKVIK